MTTVFKALGTTFKDGLFEQVEGFVGKGLIAAFNFDQVSNIEDLTKYGHSITLDEGVLRNDTHIELSANTSAFTNVHESESFSYFVVGSWTFDPAENAQVYMVSNLTQRPAADVAFAGGSNYITAGGAQMNFSEGSSNFYNSLTGSNTGYISTRGAPWSDSYLNKPMFMCLVIDANANTVTGYIPTIKSMYSEQPTAVGATMKDRPWIYAKGYTFGRSPSYGLPNYKPETKIKVYQAGFYNRALSGSEVLLQYEKSKARLAELGVSI